MNRAALKHALSRAVSVPAGVLAALAGNAGVSWLVGTLSGWSGEVVGAAVFACMTSPLAGVALIAALACVWRFGWRGAALYAPAAGAASALFWLITTAAP